MARFTRLTMREPRTRPAGPPVSQDEVATVAYALFERRGRVHGHDFEDWLEAERIVRQRAQRGNGR